MKKGWDGFQILGAGGTITIPLPIYLIEAEELEIIYLQVF